MVRKGQNGLSVAVANQLFSTSGITFEDRRADEGSYYALHPDGTKQLRKRTVTEVTRAVIDNWFTLKP